MIGGDQDQEDLGTLWVSEFGTEPPSFGEAKLRPYLGELASLPFAEAHRWAVRIVGRSLLTSETRDLQRAQGYDAFRPAARRRKTVLRRAGNGDGDRGEKRTYVEHLEGNWQRVNGIRPGLNFHNVKLRDEAQALRLRVRGYCRKALRKAREVGGAFNLRYVFAKACAAIFGRPAPYANRSKVKAFRDWIEAELGRLENVTHPPGGAFIKTPGAVEYGTPVPANDDSEILTHLPGKAPGAPHAETPAGDTEADCGAPSSGDREKGCPPSNPEGRCPSRLEPGPTPCSAKAEEARRRLVGIARSALPTLREAHRDADRIGWSSGQRRWAHGWLAHWLRMGCDAYHLVRIYGELLRRQNERAEAAGFGPGQWAPFGLRKALQQRAEGLPRYDVAHFTGRSRCWQPTATELAERRERLELRAAAAAMRPAKRVRRRSAAAILRGLENARAALGLTEEAEMSPWEVELADMNAEAAAMDMDRRRTRTESAPGRAFYAELFNVALLDGDHGKAARIRAHAEASGITL